MTGKRFSDNYKYPENDKIIFNFEALTKQNKHPDYEISFCHK